MVFLFMFWCIYGALFMVKYPQMMKNIRVCLKKAGSLYQSGGKKMPNPKIQKEIKENFNGKYSPYDFTYMATGAYVAGTYLFQYADPKGFSQMADHAFEVRKLSKGLEGEKVVGLVNSGMNNGQEKIDIPADLSEKYT